MAELYVTVEFESGGKVCALDRHVVTFLSVVTAWLYCATERRQFISAARSN